MAPVSHSQAGPPLSPARSSAHSVRSRRALPVAVTPGEGVECIVCWENFNNSTNSPHSLWCGHSLCRECVHGLPSATCTWIPTWSFPIPFLIPCPWCQWLTPRLTYNGSLQYPCKNFSLIWMLESIRPSSPAIQVKEKEKEKRELSVVKPKRSRSTVLIRRGGSSVGPQGGGISETVGEERRVTNNNIDVDTISGEVEGLQNGNGDLAEAIGSLVVFFLEGILLGIRLALRIFRKLPLIFLLAFLIIFILPLSGLVLGIYFVSSVFFAIPSSAVAIATLSFSDFLVREILR